MPLLLRPLHPDQTLPLRQRVLRPDHEPHECAYPGDDAADTGHFGVFDGERLVGVATILREGEPEDDASGWRLRGVAVDDTYRGLGVGRLLLDACMAHVASYGARSMWCNARDTATGFYKKLGWSIVGEPFEMPRIGRHYRMRLPVPAVTSRGPASHEPALTADLCRG